MKKIIICFSCVIVLSLTIFNIKSQELFVKVNNLEIEKTTQETLKATKPANTEQQVRIVIKDNNYTSIYHSKIKFTSKNLKVYYGKNYQNVKSTKKITIKKSDKLFEKSDVIKVDSKNGIYWDKADSNSEKISYDGSFYIYNTESGLVMVNQLDMEDYVAGVIASEIGTDCPKEALKAQAICARTFIANSNPKDYESYEANGDDSTSYQVYNKTAADENCRKAAEETKNQVMKYKNQLIQAYYFSTSCGYTTDYKIWGRKKRKYLLGCCTLKKELQSDITQEENFKKFITTKPEAYESDYPFYRWNVYLSNEQVQNAIYLTAGVDVGEINKISVNQRGTGGIASQITVYGKKRQLVMNNQNQIRKALCSYYAEIKLNDGTTRTKMEMLPSAYIYIENVYDSGEVCGFQIYGGGFGHGSGMSQNAAKEMAESGMGYEQILKTFYHNIKIESY